MELCAHKAQGLPRQLQRNHAPPQWVTRDQAAPRRKNSLRDGEEYSYEFLNFSGGEDGAQVLPGGPFFSPEPDLPPDQRSEPLRLGLYRHPILSRFPSLRFLVRFFIRLP
jgi:hypothetical protein